MMVRIYERCGAFGVHLQEEERSKGFAITLVSLAHAFSTRHSRHLQEEERSKGLAGEACSGLKVSWEGGEAPQVDAARERIHPA